MLPSYVCPLAVKCEVGIVEVVFKQVENSGMCSGRWYFFFILSIASRMGMLVKSETMSKLTTKQEQTFLLC